MVRIRAFQARGPGSIPGRRSPKLLFFFFLNFELIIINSFVGFK